MCRRFLAFPIFLDESGSMNEKYAAHQKIQITLQQIETLKIERNRFHSQENHRDARDFFNGLSKNFIRFGI